jgi:hypothetical protein
MQEELMDAILYLEKLKTTLASNEGLSTQEAASMSEKE